MAPSAGHTLSSGWAGVGSVAESLNRDHVTANTPANSNIICDVAINPSKHVVAS
jgi:hypothetical protein